MRPTRALSVLFLPIAFVYAGIAQVTAVPASAAPTQGSASIESQLLAYQTLGKLAGRISIEVKSKVCTGAACKPVLLTDSLAMTDLAAYKAYDEALKNLQSGYGGIGGAAAELAFADSTSAVASLITAIKSSAVYTNANFQPTPQSFLALLYSQLITDPNPITLRTSALPGDQATATLDVQAVLKATFHAREVADAIVPAKLSVTAKATRDALDKQMDALESSLTTSGPDGTVWMSIIKGRSLAKSLTDDYVTLSVSIDAAGGDSRVTHWGLYEILFPTPAPSYNGGAAVSFILASSKGEVLTAGMLTGMYDFEKLKGAKLDGNHKSVDPASSLPISGEKVTEKPCN
jgi:hypothetical protein